MNTEWERIRREYRGQWIPAIIIGCIGVSFLTWWIAGDDERRVAREDAREEKLDRLNRDETVMAFAGFIRTEGHACARVIWMHNPTPSTYRVYCNTGGKQWRYTLKWLGGEDLELTAD